MKTAHSILMAAAGAASIALTAGAASAADTFTLDPAHTQTIFAVNHLGYSTVTGNFHDLKGALVLDQEHPEKSTIAVTIGTATVDTGLAIRDDDLRSKTFFNAAQFPTMEFKSVAVKQTGDKTADVQGELTLLGVTKPVTMKVTFNRMAPDQLRKNATVAGFTATTVVKRSEFGMTAYVPYVGDDVAVTINFEGIKQ